MEISRLTFTKETKEKMEKELNRSERGQLRWNKVKEASTSGRLAWATNRYEVANIAGFTEDKKVRGYQWVSNMIHRGYLQEVMLGFGKTGRVEYEYHVVGEPDYSREKAREAKRLKNQKATPVVEAPVVVETPAEEPATEKTIYKVEITRNETTIRVELANYNEVGELIKTILKGDNNE